MALSEKAQGYISSQDALREDIRLLEDLLVIAEGYGLESHPFYTVMLELKKKCGLDLIENDKKFWAPGIIKTLP